MPPKKRFGSRAEEALQQRQAGLANAAKRRLGNGANQPGAKFGGGKTTGGGASVAASFAANAKGRFTPRTATGRPADSGVDNLKSNAAAVRLGEMGNKLGALKKANTKS